MRDSKHDSALSFLSDVEIDRLLAGELTAEERATLAQRVGDDPTRRRLLDLLNRPAELRSVGDQWEAPEARARMARQKPSQRSEQKPAQAVPGTTRVTQTRSSSWWARGAIVAAGMGAAVVLAIGYGLTRDRTDRASSEVHVYRTAPGQRSTVQLADGSTVILAPATSVTTTATHTTVVGEAYFTVAPRASRSFVVQTNNATVRVLGTRFSVRQYPSEDRSRIVVEDGRVALGARQNRSQAPSSAAHPILSSRMLALVSDSGVSVTSGIATREYMGWVQGTLVFNHRPLREVVAELSRAYGADIRIADSVLAGKTIVAEVEVHKRPLTQILDAVSDMLDAHYVRDGAAFVLAQGRSERHRPNGQRQRINDPQPERQYGR